MRLCLYLVTPTASISEELNSCSRRLRNLRTPSASLNARRAPCATMDPFSITASIVTLIQVSAQVTVLVKQFREEVSVVDTTLNGILNDVDGFQQVLQSMKETFAQEDIQADVQATGHVGSHWKNLARSLSDGESTLDQLRSLLTSVNKSTSFLDASRKQLRLKSAIAQISGFREQIQSYRAALQLSLSTIMV